MLLVGVCQASGPRYVTGPPFFTGAAGRPVVWKQTQLRYSTDPGDLGTLVNHAAADALVESAAGVWNLPLASIQVSQGTALDEHVSGANVTMTDAGLAWPADVASTNAANVPVAVVYDTDGSVTETLLGAGSSDPTECAQNAVTQTVDAFDPAGYILHAIVVVNGRCTGAAPEQQLQLQFQLERAFGRVLGLAWSQTNDNVFTGTPQPTYDQALHWPIMHPIDLVCGPYSYQCLPEPFMLRPDDVAGLLGLYPTAASVAAGNQIEGAVTFPTGEGMEGVNVLVRREQAFTTTPEAWVTTSAVSGGSFRRAGLSPFVAVEADALSSLGSTASQEQGFFAVPYVESLDPVLGQTEILSTEPVNPLYIGDASVGPYAPGIVAPAGSPPPSDTEFQVVTGTWFEADFAVTDAPATCGDGTDGTATVPSPVAAAGWWNGVLCGYGHTAYAALPVQSGRTLTVEVTALDKGGAATTTKAMPVIGIFAPTDAAGALPTLGVTPMAFQALTVGTTTLTAAPFAAGSAAGTVRIGIADQRGDGRPDFAYQARVFYADSISPSQVGAGGGTVTISGMGFRAGIEVTVNGSAADVVSATATTIVATVPGMAVSGALAGVPVDVEVLDGETGATSTMTGALSFTAVAPAAAMMRVVSAPSGTLTVGKAASPAFAVQLLAADGATPVSGQRVEFQARNASFCACGDATLVVTSDANGRAAATFTPTISGAGTVSATNEALVETLMFEAQPQAGVIRVVQAPSGSQPAGVAATPSFEVQVLGPDGATPLPSVLVAFSVTEGAAALGVCSGSPCSVLTDGRGLAQVGVTPSAAGSITIHAAFGGVSANASFTATAGDFLSVWSVPNATGYVNEDDGTFQIGLTQPDGSQLQYVPVVFSAPPGVSFAQCGSNVCTLDTDYFGGVGTHVAASVAGTYQLTVAYGNLTASTSITIGTRHPTLNILSSPSGTLPLGVPAVVPFSAQLLDGYGNPMPGQLLSVGGALGVVGLACGIGPCLDLTDGNGVVSEQITPEDPGTIVLAAIWSGLVASSSFFATGTSETLAVVSAPPATVIAGDRVSFSARAMVGPTPMQYQGASYTFGSGSLAVDGCNTGECYGSTDDTGLTVLNGTAWVPGKVTISVSVDGLVQTVSFVVAPRTYTLKLVHAPSGSYALGAVIADLFTVQLLKGDGVTPAVGQNVTFSVTDGSVTTAQCKAWPCAVVTDANGMASLGGLAALSAGPVTLVAIANTLTQSASFSVMAAIDLSEQVTILSGGQQAVTGGVAPRPVIARVTDGAGQALAGASVIVDQTVRAYVACPATGRCPSAPVLTTDSSVLTADAAGLVSVTPLTIPQTATETSLTLSAGPQGFATAEVTRTP